MGPNWAGSEFVRCIFWDGAPRGEGPVHGAQDSTWRTVGASWMRNRGTSEHRPSGRGRPDTGVGTPRPGQQGLCEGPRRPCTMWVQGVRGQLPAWGRSEVSAGLGHRPVLRPCPSRAARPQGRKSADRVHGTALRRKYGGHWGGGAEEEAGEWGAPSGPRGPACVWAFVRQLGFQSGCWPVRRETWPQPRACASPSAAQRSGQAQGDPFHARWTWHMGS